MASNNTSTGSTGKQSPKPFRFFRRISKYVWVIILYTIAIVVKIIKGMAKTVRRLPGLLLFLVAAVIFLWVFLLGKLFTIITKPLIGRFVSGVIQKTISEVLAMLVLLVLAACFPQIREFVVGLSPVTNNTNATATVSATPFVATQPTFAPSPTIIAKPVSTPTSVSPTTLEVSGVGGPVLYLNGTPLPPGKGSFTFTKTGYAVIGVFLDYWLKNGGLDIFGYPVSDVFTELGEDGKWYTVQYFQRAEFQLLDTGEVVEARIGSYLYNRKYPTPDGAPGQAQEGSNSRGFGKHTNKIVSGAFRTFWDDTGDLKIYGYPISDEFLEKNADDGRTYVVQFFERAEFIYDAQTGQMGLGLIGWEVFQLRYGNVAMPTLISITK